MVFVDVKKKKKKTRAKLQITEITVSVVLTPPRSLPPLIYFRTPPSPPPRLLIFGFSSLAQKKFEKTYLSIRNSRTSNEIDFFECFGFNVIFK